jgi:hypothetical protein
MADKKISALTSASTPLAGTEVLPIVQGANTVKVAVSDLTAGRSVSATSIVAGLGAVATPAYTFTGDLNTGMWSPAGDTTAFSTGGSERMRLDPNGYLLFRTLVGPTTAWNANSYSNFQCGVQLTHILNANTWRQLTWSGDPSDAALYFPGGTSLSAVANVAQLSPAGSWTNASDGRQKTNVQDLDYGIETVMQLKPRRYNRTDVDGNYIGFVAQELKNIIPEVVLGSDETSYGVTYGELVAVAFKAIQEQQSTIIALTSRINKLEGN